MQFVFNGSLDELKEDIRKRAAALRKDIVIYQYEPSVLQIGFLRLGYSGGRFFIANIVEENDSVVLDGEIQNLDSSMPTTDTRNIFEKISEAVLGFLGLYTFLIIIPGLIWTIFDIPHPWIVFILPAAIMAFFGFAFLFCELFCKGERSFEKEDADFLLFLSAICNRDATTPFH